MKKITLATFKKFVRENRGDLYIQKISSFDGMVDMVTDVENPMFFKVESDSLCPENTLGLKGVWLVGQSRDYFNIYDDDTFHGIGVDNCCGEFILAIKK